MELPSQTRRHPPKRIIPGVWQAYVDDDLDQPATFIFTTNKNFTNSTTDPETFDVRDLDVPSAYCLLFAHPTPVGVSNPQERLTPAYARALGAWAHWFDTEQPRLIRKALSEWITTSN